MERIASFQVDHNKLVPGMYLSRRDGQVTTLDLRFKKPNTGDLLTNAEMHSVEHIIATLLRNSRAREAVIYFGPMGCQTGFYLLYDSSLLSSADAVELVKETFASTYSPGRGLRRRDAREERRGVRELHQPGCVAGEGTVCVLPRYHPGLDDLCKAETSLAYTVSSKAT